MRISRAGRSASFRKSSPAAGLSLIELLVALAIVSLMIGLGTTALRSALDVNMKNTARRLSQTIRYLQNKAVMDNLTLRLGLNLDEHRWRVEESREPYAIAVGEEGEPEQEEAKGESEEEGASAPSNPFTPSESKLLGPNPLSSGVFFKDVQVSYLEGKRESGEIFLYFFPDGFGTGGTIHLRDEEDEDHYTIEVHPLRRRVTIASGYLEEGEVEVE